MEPLAMVRRFDRIMTNSERILSKGEKILSKDGETLAVRKKAPAVSPKKGGPANNMGLNKSLLKFWTLFKVSL